MARRVVQAHRAQVPAGECPSLVSHVGVSWRLRPGVPRRHLPLPAACPGRRRRVMTRLQRERVAVCRALLEASKRAGHVLTSRSASRFRSSARRRLVVVRAGGGGAAGFRAGGHAARAPRSAPTVPGSSGSEAFAACASRGRRLRSPPWPRGGQPCWRFCCAQHATTRARLQAVPPAPPRPPSTARATALWRLPLTCKRRARRCSSTLQARGVGHAAPLRARCRRHFMGRRPPLRAALASACPLPRAPLRAARAAWCPPALLSAGSPRPKSAACLPPARLAVRCAELWQCS